MSKPLSDILKNPQANIEGTDYRTIIIVTFLTVDYEKYVRHHSSFFLIQVLNDDCSVYVTIIN